MESSISNILSQNFDVQFQPVFHDLDEGKSREGDILAKIFPNISDIDSNKTLIAQLILPIECKNLSDHGWIFTEAKITQYQWYFTLIRSRTDILENLGPMTPLLACRLKEDISEEKKIMKSCMFKEMKIVLMTSPQAGLGRVR